MAEYAEFNRNERRSITMPNKLWDELVKITDDCMSVSEYVRQAILEKLKKEYPEKSLLYDELILGKP